MTDHPTPSYRSLWLPDLLWILLLLVAAVVPFLTPDLDLRILGGFHQPGAARPWPNELDEPWRFLYTFGTWPGILTALGGLAVVVAGRYKPGLARWRRHAALLFLTLALGPGLFVNTIFKDHWGRPRPRQVQELGGRMAYQCFYEHGIPGRGKSFPCGHSSMGYYFVALYFLARRRHRLLGVTALLFAAIYGTLIGVARIAAGAHFPSDVLWSAVFPVGVAWVLYYFILRIPYHEDYPDRTEAASWWKARWVSWIAVPLTIGVLASALLGTPAFSEISYSMPVPAGTPGTAPVLELSVMSACQVELKADPAAPRKITISGEAWGFGWPWSRIRHEAVWVESGTAPTLRFTCRTKGKFSELDGRITIHVPPGTVMKRLAP